jgi:hypothetical protein
MRPIEAMMRSAGVLRPLFLLLFLLQGAVASSPPLICPGGVAIGRIELSVVPPAGGVPRSIQTVNRLLPGDAISYRPLDLGSADGKKARIALLLVPSDGSKIVVFDPKPADQPASWMVPFRAQLASLVWGPEGLDKAKVTGLVTKDGELIGELADYAAKTEEAQALIEAITQREPLDTGQSVDAAVAGFAGRFPSTRLDRTQPTSVQLGVLLHSVNPSLSTYDPLAQNPQQQAAQTAGLAAAVGGLFLGNGAGLAASGGAVLVNLHSLLFPHAQFLSALVQDAPPASEGEPSQSTALCGSKPPAALHTQSAFLWAVRFPDAPAPALGLKVAAHLPIGMKSGVPLLASAKDWKLVPRIQDWKLISDNGAAPGNEADDNADAAPIAPTAVPVAAKVNIAAKTIELDLTGSKIARLRAGVWKLAANWDWDPVTVSGDVVLHDLPRFAAAHLTPKSQDALTSGAGTLDIELTGDDFEFVRKIEYKKQGDPFAQPQDVPFHLPKDPPAGPETSVKVRLDAKTLAAGNYVFLIAQTDGKAHEAPFKVLPAPPSISGTPIALNTGIDSQTVLLHGTGLDRVEQISADDAQVTLGDGGDSDSRAVTVKLKAGVKAGELLSLQLKAKDFAEPVSVDGAFLVAGPKPAIAAARQSSQGNLGIAINSGEMAANSLVSFELNLLHGSGVSEVDLSCDGSPDSPPVKIATGGSKADLKLTQESADTLFLSFRPATVGPPGCAVMATLIAPKSGRSEPRKLGSIVLLPQIDSFQIGNEKAGDTSYFASLDGRDLEGIAKVGWDAQTGTTVDSIPTPVAGPGNKESLRITVPWPAPAPHAPLYIWLRGEDRGRLTTAKY